MHFCSDRPQRADMFLPSRRLEGAKKTSACPLSRSVEALSEQDETFSVCLTFNLSKGGERSRMHGSCRRCVKRHWLVLTPTTNRITAHKRGRVSTSILVWKWGVMKHAIARGWRKQTRKWPTKTSGFGKYCESESRFHISSWPPALCPSSATLEVLKFSPSSLKRFLQSYLLPDDVIEHLRGFSRRPVLSSEDQLGSFKLSSKKTFGLMLREGQWGSRGRREVNREEASYGRRCKLWWAGWQPVPSVCPALLSSASFHPCNLPLPRGYNWSYFFSFWPL